MDSLWIMTGDGLYVPRQASNSTPDGHSQKSDTNRIALTLQSELADGGELQASQTGAPANSNSNDSVDVGDGPLDPLKQESARNLSGAARWAIGALVGTVPVVFGLVQVIYFSHGDMQVAQQLLQHLNVVGVVTGAFLAICQSGAFLPFLVYYRMALIAGSGPRMVDDLLSFERFSFLSALAIMMTVFSSESYVYPAAFIGWGLWAWWRAGKFYDRYNLMLEPRLEQRERVRRNMERRDPSVSDERVLRVFAELDRRRTAFPADRKKYLRRGLRGMYASLNGTVISFLLYTGGWMPAELVGIESNQKPTWAYVLEVNDSNTMLVYPGGGVRNVANGEIKMRALCPDSRTFSPNFWGMHAHRSVLALLAERANAYVDPACEDAAPIDEEYSKGSPGWLPRLWRWLVS